MPPRTTTKDTETTVTARLCTAALTCAATAPWARLSPADIAKKAKVPMATATAIAPTRDALIPLILRHAAEETQTNLPAYDAKEPLRDHVFEVLMAWFDTLQTQRAGYLSLFTYLQKKPCAGGRMMKTHLDLVHGLLAIPRNGHAPLSRHPAAITLGVTVLYALTLRAWMKDATPDLSATMATLDRLLNKIDKAIKTLSPHNND